MLNIDLSILLPKFISLCVCHMSKRTFLHFMFSPFGVTDNSFFHELILLCHCDCGFADLGSFYHLIYIAVCIYNINRENWNLSPKKKTPKQIVENKKRINTHISLIYFNLEFYYMDYKWQLKCCCKSTNTTHTHTHGRRIVAQINLHIFGKNLHIISAFVQSKWLHMCWNPQWNNFKAAAVVVDDE